VSPETVRTRPRRRVRLLVFAGAFVALLGSAVAVPMVANAGVGSSHCGVPVYGAIEDKYGELGAENGPLGCPTNEESDAARGGRWQAFQSGFVFWHPALGAHAVYGSIATKWSELGRENGVLGYPVTDETGTPDGVGRYNHFEFNGSIYWTPSTGAHAVYGAIRDKWQALGWERGVLGYPLSDEATTIDGTARYNDFQGGAINWTSTAGAHLSRIEFSWVPNLSNITGSEHLTLYQNGSYLFSGSFHDDSCCFTYDVGLIDAVRTPQGKAFVFTERGTVHGTRDPRSSTHSWNTSGQNTALAAEWMALDQSFTENANATRSSALGGLWSDVQSAIGPVSKIISVVGSL